MRLLAPSIAIALLSVACGSSKSGADLGAGTTAGATCVGNTTQACACPGGVSGAQTCREDGSGWDPCVCPGEQPDGGTGDGGPGDDASVDGPVGDAHADGPADAPFEACVASSQSASLVPLDMYVMMDQSGSMSDVISGGGVQKWQAVVNAVTTYVQTAKSPSDLGIAIQYFGLNNDTCDPAPYAAPEVPLAPLTATVTFKGQTMTQAQAIATSIGMHTPSTATPTMPAVQGMINYAKALQIQNPTHKVVAVLATDGDPSVCDDNVSNIAGVLAQGLGGSPSIPTYVIGVGTSYSNLQAIAAGGGTNNFFQVDQGPSQFVSAMETIRGAAGGCAYQLPDGADAGAVDLNQLQVRFTPGSGPGAPLPQTTFARVPTAGGCDPQTGGWYYDSPFPAQATSIILCPATCSAVKADQSGGEIELLTGCSGLHDAASGADSASCTGGQKSCNGFCVSANDPLFGCGGPSCAQCAAAPANGYSVCGPQGQCDFTCSPGFAKNVASHSCDGPAPPADCCTDADCSGQPVKTCFAGSCQADGTFPGFYAYCDPTRCDAWCRGACGGATDAGAGGTCSTPFPGIGTPCTCN